jgi:lipopolysaccharide transport system ATP-binding protein
MADTLISVEQLGKKYRIAHQVERAQYKTLRETIALKAQQALKGWRSRNEASETRNTKSEEFWALRDVSFDVKEGEVLGIIGRNGAGKSTLLKILSRITEPSRGQVRIRGRVASLLEVGTGFHPELTGRENIYLNGSILGMTKAEIRRNFDQIVAFSEVERFLDTPVKRYSSGMYVRLAFAVAAHLDPEILIVDEVLAVGDANFQKKCLGKMQDVSLSGRTVIFVSHNMNAVESLCQRLVHLRQGELIETTSDLRTGIARYLTEDGGSDENPEWVNPGNLLKNPWFFPIRFYLGNSSGEVVTEPVRNDSSVFVYIEGEIQDLDPALNVGYGLFDGRAQLLYWSAQTDTAEDKWPALSEGWNRIRAQIPVRLLNQGVYRLSLLLALYHRQWISDPEKGGPTISLSMQGGLSDSPYWRERRPGVLAPVCHWERVD